MDLQQHTEGVLRGVALPLSISTFLVRRHHKITFVAEHRMGENEVKLGHIVLGPGGAKLQAIRPLHIRPGHSQAGLTSMATALRGEEYQLEPASDGRVEIMLLRYGDIITSSDATDSVACVAPRALEAQVNSSATGQAQDELTANGVEHTAEGETKNDVASDRTFTEVPVTQPVTQPSKSQLTATPHLPRDKSLVVHETPTTSRIVNMDEYEVAHAHKDQQTAPTPQETIAVAETFSTARTNRSPTVIAPSSTDTEAVTERKRPHGSPEVRVTGRQARKRASVDPPPDPDVELSAGSRPVKRVRNDTSIDGDIHQASPLDNINADPGRTTYSAKRGKRSKVVTDVPPTKSSKSSQRSETATTAAAYEGEPPRVATSNSTIKDGNSTVKFLRKHGGTLLSSVDDKCNVLCVRDGGLAKTMKVFQAIALGIPIVTDKWLSDSAKADGFLDLSSYKPLVAQQEQDWRFSLEKVWGTAQTPFKGYCIYFTPALRKTYTNFREMERVCQTVGAEVTTKRSSKNKVTIVLATEEDDPDAEQMIEDGESYYHKDLVTTSILRGEVNLDDDEFKLKPKRTAPSRRKGSRKST